ncbi:MAG: NAD-dependent deacylase [Bacteroidales bacterium]|nr:NAD-dependent deacylase [Bacteroidales bacterium]
MTAIEQAAEAIKHAKRILAFTGAGISVESGIPPFRGSKDSLWEKYNPEIIDLDYFHAHPKETREFIRDVFYKYMSRTDIVPNAAHKFLAALEKEGKLHAIVTQNIDNLHQMAGSKTVWEFHGTTATLSCEHCDYKIASKDLDLEAEFPPRCPKCGKVIKPDFIFFGEGIPREAYEGSIAATEDVDVCIVVGTSGLVMPADMIPIMAKRNGAKIIEFNTQPSKFTEQGMTDIFVQGKAGEIMSRLAELIGAEL